MKKIILLFLFLISGVQAQTFQVNNLNASGTVTVPTPLIGSNTTIVPTTAFVDAHSPCLSIMDNGGNNTNSADNTAAFAATIAAGPSGQACVFFPAGTYKFLSNNTYTFPSGVATITMIGAGSEVTSINFPNSTGGFTLSLNNSGSSFHIRDLSITTSQQGGGTAIAITQAATNPGSAVAGATSDISNVSLRGSDGFSVNDYWTVGISEVGASNINFNNLSIYGATDCTLSCGIGVTLAGNAAMTTESVQFNFVNLLEENVHYGIQYGTYVQGVSIVNSNFTGVGIGIISPPSVNNLDQLSVTNSQFAYYLEGILTNTAIPATQISNNLFIALTTNTVGVSLAANDTFSIIGNAFTVAFGTTVTGSNGIDILVSDGNSGSIIGNNFYDLPANGIYLGPSSELVTVKGNSYFGSGAAVTNLGTNNTTDNSYIGLTSTSNLIVTGGGGPTTNTTSSAQLWNAGAQPTLSLVDSTQSANNRNAEIGFHGGQVIGRFVNDAYSGTANWMVVSGGEALGVTAISFPEPLSTVSLAHTAQESDTSYTFATPTTGTTVTIATGTETALIVPAGTLAALTITLPACTSGYNGSIARFSSTQIITALTVNATSGTVADAPTTLALGAGHAYLCRGSTTTWYQLY